MKVHTQVARKDYPEIGVKAGETYYKWGQRIMMGGRWRGVTRKSKTYPKRQQLTQSEFLAAAWDLEDAIGEATEPGDLESIISDIESLGQEQEDKLQNMPEGLQAGPTGELLQERIDGCAEWASALESAKDAWESAVNQYDDDQSEWEAYEAAMTEWEGAEPDDADDPGYQAWCDSEPDSVEEPTEPDKEEFLSDCACPCG